MADLTIGALAKRTGLTVRTLHHYDQIGLLSPSGRTDGGYRLYSDADILRLPPQLSGIVACATGKLMRIKMPLFTGSEGHKETVKIHFTK